MEGITRHNHTRTQRQRRIHQRRCSPFCRLMPYHRFNSPFLFTARRLATLTIIHHTHMSRWIHCEYSQDDPSRLSRIRIMAASNDSHVATVQPWSQTVITPLRCQHNGAKSSQSFFRRNHCRLQTKVLIQMFQQIHRRGKTVPTSTQLQQSNHITGPARPRQRHHSSPEDIHLAVRSVTTRTAERYYYLS